MRETLVTMIKEAIPDICLIYLFGSQATGGAGPDSDIDVAILADKALEPVHRWQLANLFANALHREVDLIDLRQASTVLCMEILRNGVCLYQQGQARDHFEMITLSMYQHLQQERAAILNDFKQSLQK